MPRRKKLIATAILTLGLISHFGQAEDIDIYSSPTNPADNPNVLIILDNSANWSSAAQHWAGGIKQGQSELNAIRTVITELDENINVGLMMFTEGSGTNKDGAYVRFHVRPMNSTNKAAFSEMIGYPSGCTDGSNSLNGTPNCIYKNFDDPSEKVGTAKTDYSAAMFEAFKYFGGYTSPSHASDNVAGSPVDSSHFGTARYSGNPDSKSDPDAYTGVNKANYNPILASTGASCAKNYIIFIGNGFPTQDSPSSLLSGVEGSTSQLDMPQFTTATTTQSTDLETTACGTYTDTASCQTAAATKYGTAYTSYSCTVNSTCTSGSSVTTTTSLGSGTSTCGTYASQAACLAALPTAYPGYSSYSCTAGTSCTTSVSNTTNPVHTTACISKSEVNTATKCQEYGATVAPNYSGFTCVADSTVSCASASQSVYKINATSQTVSGYTFSISGSNTTTTTSSTDSHIMSGSKSVITVTSTNTSAQPDTSVIRYTDEWAQYLYSTDVSGATGQQRVKTFTIDVFKDAQDTRQTALLMSMATAGGGKYFNATDEDSIIKALRFIFAEIQSVNSVFASSSLPVSVNTQGTYLNQVFIGMFRPDGSARPRWAGNLKQYEFKYFGSTLNLADKNGNQAMSATTGFISPCSSSYWSSDSGQYWKYSGSEAVGSCTAVTSNYPSSGSTSFYSDSPDGDVVEKGGVAQKLRGTGSSSGSLVSYSTRYNECAGGETPSTNNCRKLLTCTGTCTSLVEFNATNVTSLSSSLVEWVRGKDVDNENADIVQGINEVRPSVHGGVVHSQPAVVDYGGTTGVVAYYGADDGVFHAIDGGKTDTEGAELWGFVAPETYSRLNRLRDNGNTTALINFPGITGTTSAKDYFFDGSIGVHQNFTSGTVWIFPTMRRGGRAIYGFNVTDPASPTLMWRKGCFTNSTSDDGNCSTGWSGIGQTWSKPQVGYIKNYKDTTDPDNPVDRPVLVFGGGYDTCEDTDSQTRCTDATNRKGASIWFVDAETGDILKVYPTNYSVPGDIKLINDTDGYIKYAYAADTGGYIYRVNVGTLDSSDGTPTGTLAFGSWTDNATAAKTAVAALSTTNNARKFIFGPEVVAFLDFNIVSIGSGDRERPLADNYPCGEFSTTDGQYVSNQFYVIKDFPSAAQTEADLVPSDLINISTTAPSSTIDEDTVKGWYYDFKTAGRQCEQVVNKALTIGGKIFFGTNQPYSSVEACQTNLGVARGYYINLADGSATFTEYNGGGLPPSPVAGIVEVDGVKVPFVIGGVDPRGPLEGGEVTVTPPAFRSRLYWYLEQ